MLPEIFKNHKIVSDVINVAPQDEIQVTYSDGIVMKPGQELTPTKVKDAPTVTWPADNSKFYTLCMTDPDAPSRANPIYREWHHWLVGNIPGAQVEKGVVLSAYIGSGPPPDTGLHRYIFLVYEQPKGKIDFAEPHLPNNSAKNREKFAIRKFAAKYNLNEPIAANFFVAEYDDYVPKLYEQLKD